MVEENLIRRYLLGQLPSEERRKFEDEYFSDVNTFEAVVAIENDLIDSYARAELRGPEKRSFEQRYCSFDPKGRQIRKEHVLGLAPPSLRIPWCFVSVGFGRGLRGLVRGRLLPDVQKPRIEPRT